MAGPPLNSNASGVLSGEFAFSRLRFWNRPPYDTQESSLHLLFRAVDSGRFRQGWNYGHNFPTAGQRAS
jgi:hypothetical protein